MALAPIAPLERETTTVSQLFLDHAGCELPYGTGENQATIAVPKVNARIVTKYFQ